MTDAAHVGELGWAHDSRTDALDVQPGDFTLADTVRRELAQHGRVSAAPAQTTGPGGAASDPSQPNYRVAGSDCSWVERPSHALRVGRETGGSTQTSARATTGLRWKWRLYPPTDTGPPDCPLTMAARESNDPLETARLSTSLTSYKMSHSRDAPARQRHQRRCAFRRVTTLCSWSQKPRPHLMRSGSWQ